MTLSGHDPRPDSPSALVPLEGAALALGDGQQRVVEVVQARVEPAGVVRVAEDRCVEVVAELVEEGGDDRAVRDGASPDRDQRSHVAERKPVAPVTPRELVQLREERNISRALFPVYPRTNARTLKNWEQGRARPNSQAALLIRLVERYPGTVQRLASL